MSIPRAADWPQHPTTVRAGENWVKLLKTQGRRSGQGATLSGRTGNSARRPGMETPTKSRRLKPEERLPANPVHLRPIPGRSECWTVLRSRPYRTSLATRAFSRARVIWSVIGPMLPRTFPEGFRRQARSSLAFQSGILEEGWGPAEDSTRLRPAPFAR